jgi:hypothetical protein
MSYKLQLDVRGFIEGLCKTVPAELGVTLAIRNGVVKRLQSHFLIRAWCIYANTSLICTYSHSMKCNKGLPFLYDLMQIKDGVLE